MAANCRDPWIFDVRLQRRSDLPIIFASGYSDTAAIEAAVGPSAVLLRKPFGVGELETVVREALAGLTS